MSRRDCVFYEELTDGILKAFYRVYNTLGTGFLEKVYRNAMAIELVFDLENSVLKRIYTPLASLNLGLWLISLVILALAAGSFSPGSSEAAGMNEMPLLLWLREAPLSLSWWLWLALILMAVLALNTVVCSVDALRKKGRSIAPHLMHLGFLFVALAHLLSARGGFKETLPVREGNSLTFPGGERAVVERIDGVEGAMGMLAEYGVRMRLDDKVQQVRPNHPLFHDGFGVYVKDVELGPAPAALLEIHREPGALAALVGALLFVAGNAMLIARRRKR